MPRAERIEYENAYYHVMNRGRGRRQIFHGKDYYNAFIEGKRWPPSLGQYLKIYKCIPVIVFLSLCYLS